MRSSILRSLRSSVAAPRFAATADCAMMMWGRTQTDHSKEKEELLDAAAQASRREAEENAKLQGDLEEKQHLMAKVERDRMQLASKMEQAMRSVSVASPLT
jgi:hypothetical protein